MKFPIPDDTVFTEKATEELGLISNKLMEAYKKNSYYIEKREGYKSLEFKVNRCKDVINEIDERVGNLYKLTDDEISYLKHYDLEMRNKGE